MITILMILQGVVSSLLIVVVLLQFGKGAEAGLMGGSSDSVFTGSQQGNILSKITIFLSIVFLANSVILAKMQGNRSGSSLLEFEGNPIRAPLNPGSSESKTKQDTKDEAKRDSAQSQSSSSTDKGNTSSPKK